MYCENCGHKLGPTAKYCPQCGAKIASSHKKNIKLVIVSGLGRRVEKALQENSSPPILQFLKKLAAFDMQGLNLPEDTKSFIFDKGFKDSFNLGLDQTKLENLSEKELANITDSTAKFDKLAEQIILAGYVLRLVSKNEMQNNLSYNHAKDPKSAVNYLLELPSINHFDFSPENDGFKLPFAASFGFDGTSLIEIIYNNVVKAFPRSDVFAKENITFLLTVGWQLARFDVYRDAIDYID